MVPLPLKIDVCDIFSVFSARHTAHACGVVPLGFARRYPADVGPVNLPELIGNGFGGEVAVFYAPAAYLLGVGNGAAWQLHNFATVEAAAAENPAAALPLWCWLNNVQIAKCLPG